MDRSKFLAKMLGIYLILVSIAVSLNLQQFINTVNSLIHDLPLMFVTGFVTLILGILMVVSHNLWQWNWRLLITIIGWIILIKGASILFFPHSIDQITNLFLQNKIVAYGAAGVDFILGLILCYFGFKRS